MSAFVDDQGFLRGIPYHDGLLKAVVCEEGRALLGLQSVQGEVHVIELAGVAAMRADGFREGNIVLSIRLLTAERAADDSELRRLVRDAFDLELAMSPGRNLLLFHLESSYGADVLALCTSWSVKNGFVGVLEG